MTASRALPYKSDCHRTLIFDLPRIRRSTSLSAALRETTSGEVGKDIREQTRNVLERIKLILQAAGTSLDNVLTVTAYLTKREDLAAYNEEYGKYFPNDKPARTTVEVMLNSPELLVEITVTACIPD